MATAYDVGALRRYLLNDPEVFSLSGGRVYANELPDSEAASMPRKCVIINSTGLGSRLIMNKSYLPVSARTKDIRCYGEDPYESRRLFDAVHRALRELRRVLVAPDGGLPGVLLYSAFSSGGVFTSREENTEWYVSFSAYDVTAAEEA